MGHDPVPFGTASGIPQLHSWDALPVATCEAIARTLACWLPDPWRFTQVRFHAMGSQRRYVAFFDWRGDEFALLPGGQVTLGYDRGRPPILTSEQEQDYRDHSQGVAGFPDFSAHLDDCMTPLRVVTISPFLLEVKARDFSGNEVTPVVVPLAHGSVTLYRERTVRRRTYRQALEEACEGGFRLPTSDEWEYACGAGSRTFWRWGEECPPIDGRPWDLHLKPNAFGLYVAQDSYEDEWCTTPDVFRGGDGGGSVCGAEGGVVTWVTLATAYTNLPFGTADGKDFLDDVFLGHCRRALSLAPAFLE